MAGASPAAILARRRRQLFATAAEAEGVLPDTGYPRQLLAVDGTTQYASVVWDVGLSTEKEIYNGLFGTSVLSDSRQREARASPGCDTKQPGHVSDQAT